MKHSQIRKFLRRSCSLLLTGALCMPPAVFASQGEPRIQTSHELLDGLTYINTVSEHTAGRTESFVLELAEDSKVFPILLQSSGTIYGTATINAAVKQAQAGIIQGKGHLLVFHIPHPFACRRASIARQVRKSARAVKPRK